MSAQMNRAAARGTPFVPRFLRRLLGLLLIGLAHALLLFIGDILVTYALLGFIPLLMRGARDNVLLGVAAGLVVFTAPTFVLGGAVFVTAQDRGGGSALTTELRAEDGQSLEAYQGSPAEVVAGKAREYPAALGFALLCQGPTALAMFLIGLWAGRRRLFEWVDDHLLSLRRIRTVGLIVGDTGALIWATERTVSGFGFDAGFFLASAVDFATAPFLTAVYVVTITLLFRTPAWRRFLSPLVPDGRIALSNYLFQSLVAALIFTGYGLGLYGRVGSALGLALSLVIFAAQIPLSALWMRRFDFGSAEWALRSFTYARLQSLRSRARGSGGTPTSSPAPPDLI